ncbi:MAG: N-acetyltransferase [Bacteroidia bacterium]|nr:N-acetyltransferase [Bacteroidia bacterium]
MDSKLKEYQSGIRDVTFGKNVKIVHPINVYECEIGDNCFIGPFTEIQKGVKIGASTKVQSHTFVCELVEIGANCFIGHGVTFINDKFSDGKPAGGNQSKWQSTKIGDNVSIGSNATILPVTICDEVVIGAGAVVTKNIEEKGFYVGNPARLLRK